MKELTDISVYDSVARRLYYYVGLFGLNCLTYMLCSCLQAYYQLKEML